MNANQEYIRLCTLCQKEIAERMEPMIDGDAYCLTTSVPPVYGHYSKCEGCQFEAKYEGTIRLPQVHDLSDEKRGLIGMLNGMPHLWKATDKWCLRIVAKDEYFEGVTPEIALLRCLCYQWNIKVE